ncbi:MAG: ribosome maturation factor RimP [Streptomycetales bacterium]
MTVSSLRDRLVQLLGPVISSAGADLEDVEVTPAGKRRVLRVVVDRDGGVGLDDIAELSRNVSGVLDGSDAMGGRPYVLEVTSPGVSRPLTQPRHWRRARARLVAVQCAGGGEVVGRVVEADDDAATLDVGGATRRLPYSEVRRARVRVEFGRAAGKDEEVQPWTST